MKHYCIGHKQQLELLEEWQWHSVKFQGNKRWLCNKCIYCEGCKEYHTIGKYGGARGYGNPVKYICFKWTKSTPRSMSKRIADMSPEDVMSGVQYGNERLSYLPDSKGDWSNEHQSQKGELESTLDKI